MIAKEIEFQSGIIHETYPEYTPSGIDWIGKIPSRWKTAAIKHLVEIKITDGPHETPEFLEEGVPFVSAEAVKNGKIDFNYKRGCISPELDAIYSAKCKPKRGDVFIVKSGSTTGKVAYVDFEDNFNIWSPLALIRCKPEIDSTFLFQALSSDYFQKSIRLFWSFGTQPNIGMNVIENLRVVVPSYLEQIKIANYLNEKTNQLDKLIEQKRRLIDLLQEEKTAIINEAVTRGIDPNVSMNDSGIEWLGKIPVHWTLSKIGYISTVVRGASPRPAGDPQYFNGEDTPWITVAEVTKDDSKYLMSVTDYLTKEGAKQSRFIENGTLLLSNSGATLGVPKILKIGGCINDGSVAFLNLSEIIKIDFIYYFFKALTNTYREMMKGSGQPNLNTDIVKSTAIGLPSIEEQLKIVKYIDDKTASIKHTVSRIEREIELMEEYRTTLIDEVVTGKVKVI